jgi:hypothetical protein
MNSLEQFKIDHSQASLSYLYWDNLYRKYFGEKIDIKRTTPKVIKYKDVMESERNGIDTTITITKLQPIQYGDIEQSISIILTSEKALSYKHLFNWGNNITIEYYTNRHEKTPGELFVGQSNLYCCAYLNQDKSNFAEWTMLFEYKFFNWVKNNQDRFQIKDISTSNASMIIVPFTEIPGDFLYSWK